MSADTNNDGDDQADAERLESAGNYILAGAVLILLGFFILLGAEMMFEQHDGPVSRLVIGLGGALILFGWGKRHKWWG